MGNLTFQAVAGSVLLFDCTTFTLAKQMLKKLNRNYSKMLHAVLKRSWKQPPIKQSFVRPPTTISQTIQVRRARHAVYCLWSSGWNDKMIVLKKTTLHLYFKTFIEKNQFRYLDYVVELTSIQCSRLQPQSPPRCRSGTGNMPFPQAPVGARRILGGWRLSGWL